jgi:formylglycine-generating enzyme required for sulfatase activity
MRRAACVLLPAAALAVACFPDDFSYTSADGGGGPDATTDGIGTGDGPGADVDGSTAGDSGDGGPVIDSSFDATGTVYVEGGAFAFTMGTYAGFEDASATLDYSFVIDRYEVTVARFAGFVDAGTPVPCGGGACGLDPRYPSLRWNPAWNPLVSAADYANAGTCLNVGDAGPTYPTGPSGGGDNPINCVNWAQALAFCQWDNGKRLPTETEWLYVAIGPQNFKYPWGPNDPTPALTCNYADTQGCDFPEAVHLVTRASKDGAYGLLGGVQEWLWEKVPSATYDYPVDAGVDFAGPDHDGGLGNYFVDSWYGAPLGRSSNAHNQAGDPATGADSLGFRCLRAL